MKSNRLRSFHHFVQPQMQSAPTGTHMETSSKNQGVQSITAPASFMVVLQHAVVLSARPVSLYGHFKRPRVPVVTHRLLQVGDEDADHQRVCEDVVRVGAGRFGRGLDGLVDGLLS